MIGETVHYVIDEQCRAAIVLSKADSGTVALVWFPYDGSKFMDICDSAREDVGRARGTYHPKH